MVYSMTGYGRNEQEFESYSISVEVRSVNSRYLDTNLRVPDEIAVYENKVKKRIQEYFERGQVSVKVTLNGTEDKLTQLTINKDLLNSYNRLIQDIREELDLDDKPSVSDYLNIPDLISYEQTLPDESEVLENVLSVLNGALEDLQEMRRKEGESLHDDMLNRLNWLEEAMEQIMAESQDNSQLAKESLETRIDELLDSVPVNEDRLAQEIAYIADKVDITEETVRFSSHVKQFKELLDVKGSVGKKLNFLLQEMNREVNTMGAKANNSVISHTVVDCKNEVEKLREQVQNVE
ncbi:MAG: YicC family protein [Candidatus Marinimicrobia bacterium]|nr:YicC family protein [Candidatus Neomarinimicrobiota bacterium]MCF7829687.1 YicC family protein [Candidatus Neomarinimicrobiota bacterium]MCF7881637.1 YicC family protein [Candidatus Neomarinimicrobiota bacterium]